MNSSPMVVYSYCPNTKEYMGIDYAQVNQKGGGYIPPAFSVPFPPPEYNKDNEVVVLDDDGRWRVVEKRRKEVFFDKLKEEILQDIKSQASFLLSGTDWYVIRKMERGVDIPEEVSSYRSRVIEVLENTERELNEIDSVEALSSFFVQFPIVEE